MGLRMKVSGVKVPALHAAGDAAPSRRSHGGTAGADMGVISVALGAALMLSACASTATVTRAGQLADAGIAYADALDGLAGVAQNEVVDWHGRNLVDVQASVAAAGGLCAQAPASLPAVELADCRKASTQTTVDCAWLARQLACADAEARLSAELTRTLDAQLAAIRRYFAGLKALASYDAGSAGGDALKGFADAIATLSAEFRANPLLDATQVEGVGELGHIVFAGYQSIALKNALRRDAATIDAALAWQQKVFDHLAAEIEAIEAQQARRAYHDAVLVPFLTGRGFDAATWVEAHRVGLAPPATSADIARARDAATSLRELWRQILSGGDDLSLLDDTLKELQMLADAVAKLRSTKSVP